MAGRRRRRAGTLDQLAKYALKDGGTFLMNSSQFQNPANGTQPNAASALQTHLGVKKTLIFDQTMNQIVSDGARSASGALLSEQRFLAETAVIAGEAPNAQRTVVVAPDRHWNPADGLAKSLLSYTKGAAWLREVPLRKIESTSPQQRVFNGYPDPYQRYELGDAHLDHTQAIAERAAAFRAVMTGPVKISYERAVLRMESVAWRSSPGRAKRARNELENELKWDMRKVRVVTTKNKRVLMGGSSGRLPVLVENTLQDQAVAVRLVVTSENTAKLRLGGLDPDDALIELRPGERAQRWIPAQAAGNGNFKVNLELQIPESRGRTYGSGETITVTVTGYGRIALLITGGGLAVLFVGVGVRAIRARRRRKAEAAGDGPTGMGSAGPGEPGDGFPGSGLSRAGIPAAEFPGVSGSGPSAEAPSSPGPAPGTPAGPAAPGAPRRDLLPRGPRRPARRTGDARPSRTRARRTRAPGLRRDTRARRRRAGRPARRAPPPRRRLTCPSPEAGPPSPTPRSWTRRAPAAQAAPVTPAVPGRARPASCGPARSWRWAPSRPASPASCAPPSSSRRSAPGCSPTPTTPPTRSPTRSTTCCSAAS
ncbi:DUF6049 family protein [Actinomadura madurae]|uniref:DUF6049 family protein n=1 Tax=Actinomadura madurae TaxID=1993 RepID=UPI0024E2375D|nr:DUF6049 family protein [Actinomadura madurae]